MRGAIVLILAVATSTAVQAAEFRVGTGGAYTTIQAGIDAALAAGGRNEVKVARGTYRERLVITAADLGNLTVSGGWLPGFASRAANPAAASIVDAERAGAVVIVTWPSSGELVLDGFTITGGLSTSGLRSVMGGGLQIELRGSAGTTIRKCRIDANEISIPEAYPAEGGGVGAILEADSWLTIEDNIIRDNVARSVGNGATGAGLSVYAGGSNRVEILGNTITDNEAISIYDAQAGGLFFFTNGAVTALITDNRVVGNHVATGPDTVPGCPGGCIWTNGASRTEVRRNRWLENTVEGNLNGDQPEQLSLIAADSSRITWSDDIVAVGRAGARLFADGALSAVEATNITVADHLMYGILMGDGDGRLTLFNTIAFGNGSDLHAGSALTGRNLIGIDPRFVDPARRDHRLLPGSAAIDRGDGAPPGGLGPLDVDRQRRVQGRAVDIGAHETSDLCRVDRFGEISGVMSYAPLCSCLQDDVSRNLRCGFHFPDFFAVVKVPWPIPPGAQPKAEWTIHPWGPGEAPFQMQAVVLVGGQSIPVPGHGLTGKLRENKDASADLKLPALTQSAVLRTVIRHLPPGAQTPAAELAEIAIAVDD